MTNDMRTAIGLMSGTSLDGIDVALLRTDGEDALAFGPTLSVPYAPDLKATLHRAIKAAREGRDGADVIGKAAGEVTACHAEAVETLLQTHKIAREQIDVIGFHGQTIYHRQPKIPILTPDDHGRTWQIGDGPALARRTGIDVVHNFRAADIMVGGEGAPLAPIYHAALLRQQPEDEGVGVLNLGGVANITYVPADGAPGGLIAFDCGPGNGLIDEWVGLKTGETMDKDGALAQAGRVHTDVLREMLASPYLRQPPPKSLDRYDFKLDPILPLAPADGAATLTAFTAACVRVGADMLPAPVCRWVVCGGGRHNPAMMAALEHALDAPVVKAEALNWRGDDLEAECFAYLAVRKLRDLPISFPGTTRVPKPMPGGVLARHAA